MNKKIFIIVLINIMLFSFGIVVNAAAEGANSVDDDKTIFNRLKSEYQKNSASLPNVTVTTTDIVTLNGYSKCNGSSCTVNYMGLSSDFKVALARIVKCSNGEKYINYQSTGEGGGASYLSDNEAKLNGEAYWTAEYSVTCTSSSEGATVVQLSQDTSSSSQSSTTTNNTTTNSSSNTSNYSSSTTTDNQNTGIKTYFAVLGLVALISYIFMICVKKYNLFKNI